MCDAFWDEVRGPCTELTSTACKVAVVGAAERRGSACVKRPMFRNAPPLSAYVCSGATPPGLEKLCPRPERGSSAKPAGAPLGQDEFTAREARMATSGAVLAGAGLYGARRLYRRAAKGDLPGRTGRWLVYKVADGGGKHINDLAAFEATVDKIMDPKSVFNPLGIEGAIIGRNEFNQAKNLMDDPWYREKYPREGDRAREALSHQDNIKLNNDTVLEGLTPYER